MCVGDPVFPEPFVEKTLLSPLNGHGVLVKSHLTTRVGINPGLSVLIRRSARLSLCVSYCFGYGSFVVSFEIRSLSPPALSFFFTIVLVVGVP